MCEIKYVPNGLWQLSKPVTYETRKSDTTRSGIAQNSSVRTKTPHFNTPPRREFLIHHLTTATMPRVKARAAKNEECEEKLLRALEERAQFGTSFEDLHHKYGIPKSTLSNRAEGRQSRQKADEVYQSLNPTIEDALKKWTLQMDSQGFPPRLDLFKAVAEKLFQQQLQDSSDSKPKNLGPTWLRGFLRRHPAISARFSTPMDCQRAFANHPGHIKDYFKKLQAVIAKYRIRDENMWNMDKKGFILGKANRAKVMARAGRLPPRTTHDGTQELITVIEACGAKQGMLPPPMVVFKGTAHYKGWYTEVMEETHAYFAYSPKGYTTDESGCKNLMPRPGRNLPPPPWSTTS